MNCSCIAKFAVVLGFAALVGCSKPSDDMKKLEGSWTLISGEADGQPLPEADVKDSSLVVVGDKHTVKVGALMIEGTHKMDASKTPKQIDANDTVGPTKGKDYGIYEFKGDDEFRVSFSPEGKERPADFKTKAGTGQFTHFWKRVKK